MVPTAMVPLTRTIISVLRDSIKYYDMGFFIVTTPCLGVTEPVRRGMNALFFTVSSAATALQTKSKHLCRTESG